jgi:hypothetical protein
MNKWRGTFLLLVICCPLTLVAQTDRSAPPVSIVFAVLTKSVDAKSAGPGMGVTLRTISDVVVNGETVIPRGSQLFGRVVEARTKDKENPQSVLSLTISRAIRKDESELPLQAIIAAVAAPQKDSLADDPTYGMMHSVEPNMAGGAAGTTSTGQLSPHSKVNSTATLATADIKGGPDVSLLLQENSQGALGYDGLTLSWQLAAPPPVTVFASKGKNIELKAGTQMLLRMAPPRAAK